MADVSLDVLVTGRVQGVFFRATMRDRARSLDVRGWVRNEPDGSVAAHFEGAPDSVRTLVEWCRLGTPGAEVDQVVATDAPATGLTGFTVRRA